jgi:putative membrane protein
MKKLLSRWVSLSVAFWLATFALAGIQVTGDAFSFIGIAFVFGLVNATAGNLLRLFTFPITFLTLGLWSVVVNALMLLLTDSLSDNLSIAGFWWAVAGAVVIGIASAIINRVIDSVVR